MGFGREVVGVSGVHGVGWGGVRCGAVMVNHSRRWTVGFWGLWLG